MTHLIYELGYNPTFNILLSCYDARLEFRAPRDLRTPWEDALWGSLRNHVCAALILPLTLASNSTASTFGEG